VQNVRGISYRDGYHNYTIETGGLRVYPRLISGEHSATTPSPGALSSGLPELDDMLGGSLDQGTSVMFLGPSGVGKSTLAAQYVSAATARGERAALYTFDEAPATWLGRAERLGLSLRRHVETGLLVIRQVDPAEMTTGEFAYDVRQQVEEGARVVVIDSLNGYMHAMPEERFLVLTDQVAQTWMERKVTDLERWLHGMRRMEGRLSSNRRS